MIVAVVAARFGAAGALSPLTPRAFAPIANQNGAARQAIAAMKPGL
jgi:hypothetical protein